MKFAFDVDGVITDNPKYYSIITDALIKSGHEVYIITDFDELFRDQRIAELKRYGIKFTELIITGKKDKYCKDNAIDYLLDDDLSYFTSVNPVIQYLGKYK